MGSKERKVVSQAGSIASKGATFGLLSTDGSGIAQKLASGKEVTTLDLLSGATGTGGAASVEALKAMTPAPPELPDTMDPLEQKRRAEDILKKKDEEDFGKDGKIGIASTMLGGSISTDTSTLRKKKLLGE